MPVALRIFTEPQQGASYDDLLAVAREAEALGFDAFFRSDHYLRIGDGPGRPRAHRRVGHARPAWPATPSASGSAPSSPPVTFRLPGPLAITVAQVDAMSGGRVELGLGTGWYDQEHTAYGIPFPPLGERFERARGAAGGRHRPVGDAAGETFSFDGAHYQVVDSPALPKPVQSPRPPVIVGGCGQEAHAAARRPLRRRVQPAVPAARAPSPTRSQAVRAACDAAGRDPATMTLSAAAGRVLRRGRGRLPPPRRRHRPRTRRAAHARRRRHGRRGGRVARALHRGRRWSASTCRSSTCTTSTTCG